MCERVALETPTARKRHRCTWCGQPIEAGSRYVRERVKIDGDMTTNKLHPECDEALRACAQHEGGCIYFDAGSMPRGGFDGNLVETP